MSSAGDSAVPAALPAVQQGAVAVESEDFIVEVPELDGVTIAPGHAVSLENVESNSPILRIGPVTFEGQHQQYIGTALVVGYPPGAPGAGGSGSSGGAASLRGRAAGPQVDVHALTQRRIVMKLVSGNIQLLLQPGPGAAAASSTGAGAGAGS